MTQHAETSSLSEVDMALTCIMLSDHSSRMGETERDGSRKGKWEGQWGRDGQGEEERVGERKRKGQEVRHWLPPTLCMLTVCHVLFTTCQVCRTTMHIVIVSVVFFEGQGLLLCLWCLAWRGGAPHLAH